ncbi:NAD(P)H-dependent oxidoreductase [Bradyrhizobium sp. 162]|uniref:flavodoxin family protein n=1 Tax=Bradyrhizobium sp. 162 TaxID=2782635 RepID=UPI001FFA3C50|nr:NAD(P)H-dependent oxidoreductase [Bradyrhizobium sp. 162]
MPLLAIAYFSISGTTEKLAHAVARGADGRAQVTLCRITGGDIVSGRFQNESLLETIDGADAVAFGSPIYMGGPAAQFKAFADASSAMEPAALGQQDRSRVHHGRLRKRRSTPHTVLLFHSGRAAWHALVRTGYSRWRGSERPQSFGQPAWPGDAFD